MAYARTATQLWRLPATAAAVRLNNYVGARTAKALEAFPRLKRVEVTEGTVVTPDARRALRERGIEVSVGEETRGRKPLKRILLPKIAEPLTAAAAEIRGMCVLNRPLTTIAYAEYRLEGELEAVTTEDNAKKVRQRLRATEETFGVLHANGARVTLHIVTPQEYERVLKDSQEAAVRCGDTKARVRILSPRDAVLFAARRPTASSLQDALTIMHRAGVRHILPESAYAALLNRLASNLKAAARMTEAQLKRLTEYYAPGAPIDRLTLLEVLGDKRS